jgi:outer membrane protein
MKTRLYAAGLAAILLGSASAHAADGAQPKWFARAAVTQLTLADDMRLQLAGTPVPTAGVDTKSHYTPTVHIGRFVTDNIALSLTGGLPPKIEINGTGALAPAGKVVDITYGPATAMVQYHVNRGGAISPYAGIGACYMLVLDVDDAALQNARVENDLAPAIEVGAEFKVAKRYGVFVEAKKAFLHTEARGTFGGAPVKSHIRLDPWAVSAGATFHF